MIKKDKLLRLKKVAEYLAIVNNTVWYFGAAKILLQLIKFSLRITLWKQFDLGTFIASCI